MKILLKNKEYESGKLVMFHAIEAMSIEKRMKSGELDEMQSVEIMIDILAQSLINGTEKTPYDEITKERLDEMKKIIKYNLPLNELEPIYVQLMDEMSGKHKADEGK